MQLSLKVNKFWCIVQEQEQILHVGLRTHFASSTSLYRVVYNSPDSNVNVYVDLSGYEVGEKRDLLGNLNLNQTDL